MKFPAKFLRSLAGLPLVLACLLAAPASGALAYGAADQPLAQLELSGNCDNPGYFLCSPEIFGLGGIWLWVEIDNVNGAHTADFAGSGCGHVLGGNQGSQSNPGAGAGSIKGETTWTYSTGVPAGAFPFGIDPHNSYYVFSITDQEGTETFAVPTTVGHYQNQYPNGPVPGVTIATQVAP
ncbi:MAG: hypothetical protein KGJ86_00820 [Chloroflexota bacterium]|nr:hypothetical protein [Chloroflexota bacterium]